MPMIKRFKKIILSSGLPDKEMAAMELGLAHYLSRYKLKFARQARQDWHNDCSSECIGQCEPKCSRINSRFLIAFSYSYLLSILHEQVVEIQEYRGQLYEYLKNRMMAIAPNLTVLVGEVVGARLIAHAGTLMNLAKHPASTVQILGAEKALFKVK